jgi:hypothetical protein
MAVSYGRRLWTRLLNQEWDLPQTHELWLWFKKHSAEEGSCLENTQNECSSIVTVPFD